MAVKFRGLIGAIVMLGALSANLPGVPAMAATQTAAPVVAVAGEVAETGGISGRLLDPAGGGGLAGTQVGITPAISCGTSSGTRYASTDESGEFAVTGLPVGGYRIQVLGSTLPQPQYAPGTLDSTTATVVHVVADQVTAVPAFTPIAGGTVVGTVAAAGSGHGVANVQVRLTSKTYPQAYGVYAYTDGTGHYESAAVPPGQVIAKFVDPSGALAYQFSGGVPGPESAAVPFAVTAGHSTAVNADLEPAAHITGRVTDAGGTGVAGLSVSVIRVTGGGQYDYSYEVDAYAGTDASGSYSIGGMPTGAYRLQVYDGRDSRQYVTSWYPGGSMATASDVAVTAPNTTAGINLSMLVGQGITGRLTDAAGSPLANTWVNASANDAHGSAQTDPGGVFTIPALGPGSYRLSTYLNGRSYYYDQTTDYQSAQLVALTSSGPTNIGDMRVAIIGCTASAVTLTSSLAPSAGGQPVTFTATVSGSASSTPTGTVRFVRNGQTVGQGAVDASGTTTMTMDSLPTGTSTLWAVYDGDQTYASSQSPNLVQQVVETSTTTSLTASPNPVASDSAALLTATVTPDVTGTTPKGTVSFYDGATLLGTRDVSGAQATLNASGLSVGSHSLTARFAASGGFGSSDSPSVTLQVVSSDHRVLVHVRDIGGDPISGAHVGLVMASGQTFTVDADANGDVTIDVGAPGSFGISAYKTGYRPSTQPGTVSDSGTEITVTLQAGPLGAALLSAQRLTLDQITALGIDPDDPANSHVESFKIKIPGVGVLCGVANNSGIVSGAGVPDPDCSPGSTFSDAGYSFEATSTYVGVLYSPGVHFLKEFFQVQLTIVNLSDPGFPFDEGTATLTLPSGLSLAPTVVPQSPVATLPAIDGGASGTVEWVVRGDDAGQYQLTAGASTNLKITGLPDVPVDFEASTTIKVWGGDALELVVQPEDAVYAHHPYRVRIGLKNVSDIVVYAAGVQLSTAASAQPYIFQPDQTMSFYAPSIAPGTTWWSGDYILLSANQTPIDVSQTVIEKLAGDVALATSVVSTPAKFGSSTFPSITATPGVESVQLAWAPVPGATGYRIYTTTDDLTPFGSAPIATVDGSTTQVAVDAPANVPLWYAVSPVVNDLAAMDHEMIRVTAKERPRPSTGGNSSSSNGTGGPSGSTSGDSSAGSPSSGGDSNAGGATGPSSQKVCKPVLFIGARGSGQSPKENDNWTDMGYQVYSVYESVQRSLGSRVEGLTVPNPPYVARSVGKLLVDPGDYFGGLEKGVTWVEKTLRSRATGSCKSQRIILSGYSQGAMLMHRVLQDLAGGSASDKAILKRVDGAVLVADGDREPGEQTVNYGSAGRGTGIGYKFSALSRVRKEALPNSLLSRVHSICHKNDIVCDSRGELSLAMLKSANPIVVARLAVWANYHVQSYNDTADMRLAASRAARVAYEHIH